MGWTRFTVARKYIPNKYQTPDSIMNDEIVPTGKYKGCHRLEVPLSYIYEVTNTSGNFYSSKLAKFFYREKVKLHIQAKKNINY